MKLFGAYGVVPLLVCDSADFNGTTHTLSRGSDLTGSADSKKGIFSVWLRLDGGDAATQRVICGVDTPGAANTHVLLERDTANKFAVTMRNAASTDILLMTTVSTFIAGATWRHVLASWDLATAGARHLYINDVSDISVTTFTNDTIDYTEANYRIGSSDNGFFFFNGCMAELYFAQGQYLDFSLVSNRRRFISATGKPVHLSANGALPTGTPPIVYEHLDDLEAVANFATNRGTGGNFTITGTLATGSSSPSD